MAPAKRIRRAGIRLYHSVLAFSGIDGILTKCIRRALSEFFFLQNLGNFPKAEQFLALCGAGISRFRPLRRAAFAKSAASVWKSLLFQQYEQVAKFSDFSAAGKLTELLAQGRGLLLFAYHYGPGAYTFTLTKNGILPYTLVGKNNIDSVSAPENEAMPDKKFLSTYGRLKTQGLSEKSLVEAILKGGAGLIMMDVPASVNCRAASLLGAPFPIGTFPFRIIERYKIPAAIIWFSPGKKTGHFTLHVSPLPSSDLNENIALYTNRLEALVKAEPGLWWLSGEYIDFRRKGMNVMFPEDREA